MLYDPDTNFYRDVYNCNHYTEHKFNEKLQNANRSNDLSFFHVNIRSLSRNFDALSLFLSNIQTRFSIIGLSETWLQHSDIQVDIPGYKCIHNHRLNRSGGGVGLYFSGDLNYKVRKDLNYDSACAESLFIEMVKPRGKNIIVAVVYRPPGQNVNEFIVNTDSLISKISRENKILKLEDIYLFNLGKFIYQYKHNLLPIVWNVHS